MTRLDFFTILIIVLLSLSAIFMMPKNKGELIEVRVDGKLIYSAEFSRDVYTKVIESKYGHNTIEIGPDYVRVIEASCPNKLDIKQGKISYSGESIICIPNHLSITIVSGDRDYDVIVR